MILKDRLHLAYCTNVHPGQTWEETFSSLNRWTLQVKTRVGAKGPYAIGLRLSRQASLELAQSATFLEFQRWLEKNECYVFTVNGFPYGRFHGTGVKENVYLPDWTTPERVEYTLLLADLLSRLMPRHLEGSISTLPGSFKQFVTSSEQERMIRDQIWRCAQKLAEVHDRTGRKISLALEPEPCCLLENTEETVRFFDRLRDEHPAERNIADCLGVNYDTCHFAVEFEQAHEAIRRFHEHGVRITKVHLSNALKLRNTREGLEQLSALAEGVYLHQVVIRHSDGSLEKFKDIDAALLHRGAQRAPEQEEWRVHFHIPLYSKPFGAFDTTADHVSDLLMSMGSQAEPCLQFEIETYTWAVLPESLRTQEITEHIAQEYRWTLRQMAEHGLT